MSSSALQLVNVSDVAVPARDALATVAQPPEGDHPFTRRFWTAPLDLRPLGLMRITLGTVVLWSLATVAPVLRALLSDEGVLPRSVLLGGVARADRFSVFDLAGPLAMTWALWLLAVVATLAFVAGWRTRWAAIATFVLVSGLHERNPMIFDGSDSVARVFLFWCLFLPIGATYSVDAAEARAAGRPLPMHGAPFVVRLLQLQLCWIYVCTFLCKIGDRTWENGTALHYAFGLDHLFTRRLGAALFNAGWLTVPATYGTLAFEAAFVLLVFAPIQQSRLRKLALLAGLGLHVGIALTMNVGNFSLMMLASYPLLFEPRWAEALVARARRICRRAGASGCWCRGVRSSSGRSRCGRSRGGRATAPSAARSWRRRWSWPCSTRCRARRARTCRGRSRASCASSSCGSAGTCSRRGRCRPIAPCAPRACSSTVARSTRLHGIDGGPVSFNGIDSNHRWTKYALALTKEQPSPRRTRLFKALGRYLCASWRTAGGVDGQPLDHFALYEDYSLTPAPGHTQREWKSERMWEQECD